MEQGELFIPMNFQGKQTSFGNPTSQRVSLETLAHIQFFLETVRKLFLRNITLLYISEKIKIEHNEQTAS